MDDLNEVVQWADRGIVSKTRVDCPKAKLVLFAMNTGQSTSSHSASTPAAIYVIGGAGTIRSGDTEYDGKSGSIYCRPAGLSHALTATANLVFLLNLFR